MRVLKRENVQLGQLHLPGEIAKLSRDPQLDGLAMTFREVGMIHPLVIRKADDRLITGRKRAAAAVREGIKEVPVCYVDCTDHEADLVTEIENAYRLHDRTEQRQAMLRLVDLRTIEIETSASGPPLSQSGRRRSARAVAIEEVAIVTGYQPAYVRVQDWRQRTNTPTGRKKRDDAPPEPEYPIDCLGVIPDDALIERVKAIVAQQQKTLKVFKRLRSSVEKLGTLYGDSGWPEGFLAELEVENSLEALTPFAVCPWCKSFDTLQKDCTYCDGRGWVHKEPFSHAPPKLLDSENVCVLVNGNIVSAEDVDSEREPEPKPKPEEPTPDWM